jgi:hypothetical protein
MSIYRGDTVRFRNGYGSCNWEVLERGKRRAILRIEGRPRSLLISTNVHMLRLATPKEKRS